MAYSTDKTIETYNKSDRCAVKHSPESSNTAIGLISQIIVNTTNNEAYRHSREETSYPEQRPAPCGADAPPWRYMGVANDYVKPQNT